MGEGDEGASRRKSAALKQPFYLFQMFLLRNLKKNSRFAAKLRDTSVDEVDHRPIASVQKPGELGKVWRGHVVEHCVVIPVIRQV